MLICSSEECAVWDYNTGKPQSPVIFSKERFLDSSLTSFCDGYGMRWMS